MSFQDFCGLASRFMEEDTDTEAMQQELREAFRLYDREGDGYITTDVFRDILHELDDALSPEELDMIIDEVDADGSGTVDFEGEQIRLDRSINHPMLRSKFMRTNMTWFALQNSWRS